MLLVVNRIGFVCTITGSVQLEVRLMPATNRFEVSENGNLAVSGEFPVNVRHHSQLLDKCHILDS